MRSPRKCRIDNEPLLSASTSTLSTELLGLHPTRVGDQECSRDEVQLKWMRGEIKVVCTTIALGLGTFSSFFNERFRFFDFNGS